MEHAHRDGRARAADQRHPVVVRLGEGAGVLLLPGQKIANLRRNPVCTVLVDRNERFPELLGVMLQGRANVLENAEQEAADPHLEEVRWLMGTKYAGGHGEPQSDGPVRYPQTATGRSARWVVFESDHLISWDNHKLPRLKAR